MSGLEATLAPRETGLSASETERNQTFVLQSFVLPDVSRAYKLGLYVRSTPGPIRLAEADGLRIDAGKTVDFTTFFNAFSHRKWRELTGLDTLSLRLFGQGTVEIVIADYRDTTAAWVVHRQSVTLDERGTDISLPTLAPLHGELLGVTMIAGAAPARLTAASWITLRKPRRPVALAAIITTFGRAAAIGEAMTSFADHVCAHAPLGSVELLVVDNESRLAPFPSPGVRVIHNANLGGAGGFSRGLMEAMDAGRFTHALFMDDDAACEPESVWRTIALLAYIEDGRSAVAGSMLLSHRPCMQYEKGAKLDRVGRGGPTFAGNKPCADLSVLHKLCVNECDKPIDYGAWWFFAFALDAVTAMPFPFFVRGDDVDFSIANNFKIVTLNGVATWCDSFNTKVGPSVEYLAFRAWLALALMHGNRKAARDAFRNCLITAEKCAYRFDYVTMSAILDGVEDAMAGPEMFTDNPAPLAKLGAYRAQVRREPTEDDFARVSRQLWHGLSRRWSRLPLSGHFSAFLSRRATAVRYARIPWEFDRKGLGGAGRAMYGEATALAMFTLDRDQLLAGLSRLAHIRRLRRALPALQDRYRAIESPVRTRAYWERALGLKD